MQGIMGWLISGFIGVLFGMVSAWVTYRYERRRDDIAWEREKKKLLEQFAHEKELLELQLQEQADRQKAMELRHQLTKGVEDAEKEINAIEQFIARTRHPDIDAVSADYLQGAAQMLVDNAEEFRSAISSVVPERAKEEAGRVFWMRGQVEGLCMFINRMVNEVDDMRQ